MEDHYDIKSEAEMWIYFPRPWSVSEEGAEIIAANGKNVIVTDSGFYPPGPFTSQFIVDVINKLKV